MIPVDPDEGDATLETAGWTKNKLRDHNICVTIHAAVPSFTPMGRKRIKVNIFVQLASTSTGVKY
jgi:hypothetical protein